MFFSDDMGTCWRITMPVIEHDPDRTIDRQTAHYLEFSATGRTMRYVSDYDGTYTESHYDENLGMDMDGEFPLKVFAHTDIKISAINFITVEDFGTDGPEPVLAFYGNFPYTAINFRSLEVALSVRNILLPLISVK